MTVNSPTCELSRWEISESSSDKRLSGRIRDYKGIVPLQPRRIFEGMQFRTGIRRERNIAADVAAKKKVCQMLDTARTDPRAVPLVSFHVATLMDHLHPNISGRKGSFGKWKRILVQIWNLCSKMIYFVSLESVHVDPYGRW
jgi:hypothetical protein